MFDSFFRTSYSRIYDGIQGLLTCKDATACITLAGTFTLWEVGNPDVVMVPPGSARDSSAFLAP
jgi:hypothetical protein